MGILKSESFQKGILFSTGFNFLAKGLLFFNSILIAFYFGAQQKTDVYFFVFNSINLLAYFFSALNTTVLVPESMRLRANFGEKMGMAFFNKFLFYYSALGIVLALVTYIFPLQIFSLFSKFEISVLDRNLGVLRLGVPVFLLMLLTNFLTELMSSYRYFSLPMIAQFINNVFVLLVLVLFHTYLDIASIFVGLLFAYSINLLILIYLLKTRMDWSFFNLNVKIRAKVWYDIVLAQIGNLASLLGSFTPSYVFSGFSGIITALNYGQKTANMPSDLISAQFSAVAGIRINELYAQKDFTRLNLVFNETAKGLLFMLIPLVSFISYFANEIIQTLYVRGAFDMNVAEISAFFLKMLVVLVPIYSIVGLISRLMSSVQKIYLNLLVQIIVNLSIVFLTSYFVRIFSYQGFAYAMLLSAVLQTILVLIILRVSFSFIKMGPVFLFSITMVAISAVVLSICALLANYVMADIPSFFKLLLLFPLFCILIISASFLVNIKLELTKQLYGFLRIRKL